MNDKPPTDSQSKIVVLGAKKIRRVWVDEEWFFSVVDIGGALTDSANPRNYWNMMKAREKEASEVQLSTVCVQLKLTSADGKSYKTDAVNTEGAFRIIQSIPSPKAEPFKRWLAKVGCERVQEIEKSSGFELSTLCRQLRQGRAPRAHRAWTARRRKTCPDDSPLPLRRRPACPLWSMRVKALI